MVGPLVISSGSPGDFSERTHTFLFLLSAHKLIQSICLCLPLRLLLLLLLSSLTKIILINLIYIYTIEALS